MQFTPQELTVFAYIKMLRDTKACKTSHEAEPLLRQKFYFVTMSNAHTYLSKYFRYCEKIEALLAEREGIQTEQNVQACQAQAY